MKTSEAQKKASMKYAKEKLKRIPLDVSNQYYDGTLKPAANAAGVGVNTYIKQAIFEKIERDQGNKET